MSSKVKSLEDWLASPNVSETLKEELRQLQALSQEGDLAAKEELDDRLSEELKFGTSGLRGIMGAGNNRMNFHTVAKATQGLAQYLLKHYKDPLVCIAYDSRHMSRRFAEGTAMVLCANGIRVQLFSKICPTPLLSYTIRKLKAAAGVVITASHNPREYNGYKVYNSYGGQITGEVAKEILDFIGNCDLFESPQYMQLEEAAKKGLFQWVAPEIVRSYYDEVKLLVQRKAMVADHADKLHLLYTPLYGTGAEPIKQIFTELGFRIDFVEEQMEPNGDFPTTPYPNPEKEAVYDIAREIATKTFPDIILATDPDCDRIGILVRNQLGQYVMLTGNQIGLLMCHYLLEQMKIKGKKLSPQATVFSTVVSSDLLEKLCSYYNVKFQAMMPGFKYISEKIESLEQAYPDSFIFGMEESNGFLTGNVSRDKDGVISSLLMAEIALYYKLKKMNLLDALAEIYDKLGYSLEETLFFTMSGQKGKRQMREIMNQMRCHFSLQQGGKAIENGCTEPPATVGESAVAAWANKGIEEKLRRILPDVKSFKDYLLGIEGLPAGNLLKIELKDGSWLALRPSGTEAKLKVYVAAKGRDKLSAQERLKQLKQVAQEIVSLV